LKQLKHSNLLFIAGVSIILLSFYQHQSLDEHVCINEIDEVLDGIFHFHENAHIDCESVTLLDPTDFNHIPVYASIVLIVIAVYLKSKKQ
jgi:hypothetical protein